jgi:hypothetical protein
VSRLRPGGAAAPAAALAATLATLAACSSLRTAPTEHAPEPPPLENSESAAPAPVTAEPPPPSASADSTPSETANAAAAPCVPPETKPKPKPRPKPKPVRREAPPQLPTSPSVAETPAGGVVNAQVKLMPVAVMSILGKPVKGPNGEDLGRVVDVLADASGRVRIAIVDFGGFLGVGDRRIAVDWPLLRFNPDGGDSSLLLSVGRDKLKSAPEYKGTPRPETLMEPESAAAPQAAAVSAAPSVPADKKN